MEDILGIASPLTQYEPYNGMEGHQLGQQGFDKKYHNDPLMQALMKARAFDQILGAFTPQIAQGGGQNAFLDTLLGDTAQAAPAAAPAPAPAAAPAPAPVEAAPMAAPEARNDGYDNPLSSFGATGQGGGDGYGLYGNPQGFAGGGVMGDGFGGGDGGGGK